MTPHQLASIDSLTFMVRSIKDGDAAADVDGCAGDGVSTMTVTSGGFDVKKAGMTAYTGGAGQLDLAFGSDGEANPIVGSGTFTDGAGTKYVVKNEE